MDTEGCSRRDVSEYAVQQGKYVQTIKTETKLGYERLKKRVANIILVLIC